MKSFVVHRALSWEDSLRTYLWFILKVWWHFKAPKFGALGVWEEKRLPSSTVQNEHFVDGWLILWIIILESKKYIPRFSVHWLQLQSISAHWALQETLLPKSRKWWWMGEFGKWDTSKTHQNQTAQVAWCPLASGSSSRAVVLSVLLWYHVRTPQTCTSGSPPRSVESESLGMRRGSCFHLLPDGFFAHGSLRITALENAHSEN